MSEEPGRWQDSSIPLAFAVCGVVSLAIGLWLRAGGLFSTPMWLDEAYSAYAVEKGFAFTWTVVPRYDVHPPLYYTLLGVWARIFGDSLAGLRMLGLICGISTIVVTALAGREAARGLRLDGRLAGCAAASLAALSPLAVDMSREVRPYPVMMLVYAAAIVAVLRIGQRATEGAPLSRRAVIVYFVALELILWLHNLGPLYGASLVLALAVLVIGTPLERKDGFILVLGHLVVAAAYLPALLVLLDQAPTWVGSTWLTFQGRDLHWNLAQLWATDRPTAAVVGLSLALFGAVIAFARGGSRIVVALSMAAAFPAAAAVALSVWVAPVFLPRAMTPIVVPALILMAIGASAAKGRWSWAGLVALVLVLHQMLIAVEEPGQRAPRQDWYGAVRWLEERMAPGDVVYAYPNEGVLPFDRAVRDLGLSMPSRPIPTPVPAPDVGWHPMGNRGAVALSREASRTYADEQTTRNVKTVWLLRIFPGSYDHDDTFLESMSRGRIVVDQANFATFDIVGLRRVEE